MTIEFSDWLRREREEKGMARPVLARTLGIALNTLVNYENGSTAPNDEVLGRIAAEFRQKFIGLWIMANNRAHPRIVDALKKRA